MSNPSTKNRTRTPLSFQVPPSRSEALALVRRLRREVNAIYDQVDRLEDRFQTDLSFGAEEYTRQREALLAALFTKRAYVNALTGLLNSFDVVFRADLVASASSSSGWRSPARPLLALTGRRR
jgi:hypothetical protein